MFKPSPEFAVLLLKVNTSTSIKVTGCSAAALADTSRTGVVVDLDVWVGGVREEVRRGFLGGGFEVRRERGEGG